ncbi:mechanosensitive ion channel family protein [Mesoflavibacter sp. SCSIO 43206]|uniref:mechanosensitive ion channel family protein n=1 Tax=Mesoflavibacter sp. SCSIO 43206 TaxID=2779362 RepID=UPI001CA80CB1|nr:mechanosensitive ion channel domain-containing protein [Mesoflavibacter sp. SCSIO 43206]UAB74214.1 mechanosensitive ion channel [Mesoflavibacter sp. SCSIO 43206]
MKEEWIDTGIKYATDYGLRIVAAIIIWVVGSWIIKNLLTSTKKFMNKRDYDESLKKFLINFLGWVLKILLILAILSKLGVETTSFAAILAAAGLAVGMALQGSLGNFAGGVLLMIFKPIKIGDLIEAQGEIGVVKEIEIFTTKLIGLSNKEIIIPNGALSNGNIVNYTTEGTRRVDLVFGVGYDSDIKKTKEVLMKVITDNPKVLQEPAPTVNVLELADSSVNFAVRPWCKTEDYWAVYFETMEKTKEALDAAGIEIPYPHQVEIHKEN